MKKVHNHDICVCSSCGLGFDTTVFYLHQTTCDGRMSDGIEGIGEDLTIRNDSNEDDEALKVMKTIDARDHKCACIFFQGPAAYFMLPWMLPVTTGVLAAKAPPGLLPRPASQPRSMFIEPDQ